MAHIQWIESIMKRAAADHFPQHSTQTVSRLDGRMDDRFKGNSFLNALIRRGLNWRMVSQIITINGSAHMKIVFELIDIIIKFCLN